VLHEICAPHVFQHPITRKPMLNLYDCVAHQHDLAMVALAAAICALGAYATFALGGHARSSKQEASRIRWTLLTIFTSTSAIWATHFIAMLAFRVPMPSGFLLVPTVVSFAVALGLVGVAGFLDLYARSRVVSIAVGTLLGIAISAMHYTGMAAFRVVGTVAWEPVTVVVSILLGVGFSIAAVLSVGRGKEPRVLLPAVLFLLAVCGDHFVAMSAASVTFDPRVTLPDGLLESRSLTMPVAAVALVLLALAYAASGLHRATLSRLASERRRLEVFADFAVEGLLICDGPTVIWANRSAELLLGRAPRSLVGRPLAAILPTESIAKLSDAREIDVVIHGGAEPLPVRVITKTIEFDGRSHAIVALRDQRDRLRVEAEMRRLADTDSLTGLVNRGRFNETLDQWLGSRRIEERAVALFALDLDRFKPVNDTHGHAAGDAVLVRVAGRLQSIVRSGTLVARIGGDEFSVIAHGLTDLDDVRGLADRIVEVLSRPIAIDGQIYEIGVSVGVALAPSDGDTSGVLVRNADLALYRAKENGGGTYRMFEAGMDAQMQARRGLEIALRRAVARQEFRLYYQPQVDARTGAFTGAEALIRWIDPERGVVPPSEFIAIAEQTNLITGIGEWVLHTACAEAATWPDPLTVAVNVSPVQFRDPRLVATVAAALEESGLPGHRLELEITEGVLIDDEENVLSLLQELRRLGVRISLDDFGTGYSSLRHLHRFPFDKIKIDRAFVSRAPDDRDSAAIVRAIVSLGESLGISTTAEGVETAEQRDFVAHEGCDQIQGYLYSRPVPASEMPSDFHPRVSKPWPYSGSSTVAIAN
jgi:diguanylate cyclase (GGDEF)-like protein